LTGIKAGIKMVTTKKKKASAKKRSPKKTAKRSSVKKKEAVEATKRSVRRKEAVATAQQALKNGKKHRSHGVTVKRVNVDTDPPSADLVAGELGFDELARALTHVKPKAVVPDFEKRANGGKITRRDLAEQGLKFVTTEEDEDLADAFKDAFSGGTGLAAYIVTRSALEKVQTFENLVADATKEYWQAKRKLLLVNKVLDSAYKSIETEDSDKVVWPSKDEVNKIVQDAFANQLFPDDAPLRRTGQTPIK
jgi:hypothetical protein